MEKPLPGAEARSFGRLQWLQSGRGIAALLVLLFHCSGTVKEPGLAANFFSFGYSGVDFFFPLSGFIISYVHWRDTGNPAQLPYFFWKRATRVYPLYWVILACTLLLSSAHHPMWDVFWDFAILGGVTWTLTYELMFYAIFAVTIVHRNIGLFAIGLWCVISGLYIGLEGNRDDTIAGFVFGRFTFEFILGVIAARLIVLRAVSNYRIFLWTGLFAFAGLAICDHWIVNKESFRFSYAAASFLLITGLVLFESCKRAAAPRWLTFLGDASYSIFLCHIPFLNLTERILPRFGFHSAWLPFALAVGGGVTGIAGHLLVEAPLLRLFARLMPATFRSTAGARLPGVFGQMPAHE